MNWLKVNLSWLTRSITDVFNVPLQCAFNLLAKGCKIGHGPEALVLPRLSWVGICAAFAIAGLRLRRHGGSARWPAAASSTSRCSASGTARC